MGTTSGKVERALAAECESGDVEFKESFEPTSRGWAELVKDVVAIANSGGGVIIFGVDDRGTPVREPKEMLVLDSAEITKKVHKYTEVHFDGFEICKADKMGKPVAAIEVGPVDVPMIFAKPGTFPDAAGKQQTAFGQGTVYFRHGAQSTPGTSADLRDAVERIRQHWLKNVRRMTEAPLGSVVEVLPSRLAASGETEGIPIRLTADPSATTYGIADPNETHPYRTVEVVDKINDSLRAGFYVNRHDVRAMREVYDLDRRRETVHTPRHGPRVFSPLFAAWVAEQVSGDPRFIRNTRQAFRRMKRSAAA